MSASMGDRAASRSKGAPGPGGTVTRDQIEAKLRELSGEAGEVGAQAKQYVVVAGAAVAVAVVGLAYVLGRRKGRKRTTVVEVRRV